MRASGCRLYALEADRQRNCWDEEHVFFCGAAVGLPGPLTISHVGTVSPLLLGSLCCCSLSLSCCVVERCVCGGWCSTPRRCWQAVGCLGCDHCCAGPSTACISCEVCALHVFLWCASACHLLVCVACKAYATCVLRCFCHTCLLGWMPHHHSIYRIPTLA